MKSILIGLYLLILFGGLYGQEAVTSSGGEATGTGGGVSYSIGQVAFSTYTGPNGSAAQGVQHAYEISTSWEREPEISFSLLVFPNPMVDELTIKIEGHFSDLSLKLYDLKGNLLVSRRLVDAITSINTVELPGSMYLAKVFKRGDHLKTFKIIKK